MWGTTDEGDTVVWGTADEGDTVVWVPPTRGTPWCGARVAPTRTASRRSGRTPSMQEPRAFDRAPDPLAWHVLPRIAQIYVTLVIVAGAAGLAAWLPRTYPEPILFASLLLLACVTSAWKVTLSDPAGPNGSTLSVSYAANLMALLLLGPRPAVFIAVAGVLTQCTVNVKSALSLYRTVFSVAAEALTMRRTGLVFLSLGGPPAALDVASSREAAGRGDPDVFLPQYGPRRLAIALSTGRRRGTSGATISSGARPLHGGG